MVQRAFKTCARMCPVVSNKPINQPWFQTVQKLACSICFVGYSSITSRFDLYCILTTVFRSHQSIWRGISSYNFKWTVDCINVMLSFWFYFVKLVHLTGMTLSQAVKQPFPSECLGLRGFWTGKYLNWDHKWSLFRQTEHCMGVKWHIA